MCVYFFPFGALKYGKHFWTSTCRDTIATPPFPPPPEHAVFCGKNGSAVMCLNMRALEDKVQRREIIADRLEKTRSLERMTGKKKMHR